MLREALTIGLVTEVVPRDRLLSRAEELAGIAQQAPLAVRADKQAVAKGLEMSLDEGL